MNRVFHSVIGAVATIAILVLSGYGCSMKWIQGDGDSQPGQSSAKKSGDGFPDMSRGDTRSELSGFSANPSEERLSQNSYKASLAPSSEHGTRHRAELSKAAQAALEAGLEDVFFAYDQWRLSDTAMRSLNHDAEWLKNHPGATFQIEGHCDDRGTSDYNVVLGEKRAKAARSYLIELGVKPKQLATVSYGKERPFCTEHSEMCYQQNRRGHVLLHTK